MQQEYCFVYNFELFWVLYWKMVFNTQLTITVISGWSLYTDEEPPPPPQTKRREKKKKKKAG